MVASVAGRPYAGSDYPSSTGKRTSIFISAGIAVAGLLVAIGMVLEAHTGVATGSGLGQAPGITAIPAVPPREPAAVQALPAHSPNRSSSTEVLSRPSSGGLVPTTNVNDLPRVAATAIRHVVVPVAPPKPAHAAAAPGATRSPAAVASAQESDSPETEDTTAATVAAGSPRKEPPAESAAPEATAAPAAPSAAPVAAQAPPEDPLIKAMRQAVDDEAHGK